ncbi:MAG: sugar phosphate isomerase/epimerase family protein [Lachnospiraceae bacterium]
MTKNTPKQYGMPVLVEKQTLAENVSLCRDLGLSFLELNMSFPICQLPMLADPGLVKLAEDAGIYYTIHLEDDFSPSVFNPLVRKAYLQTLQGAIDVAKTFLPLRDQFGDPSQPLVLNMHLAPGPYVTLPERRVYLQEDNPSRYLGTMKEFAEKVTEWVGDADLRIAVENTGGYTPLQQEVLEDLLSYPVFALTWDIGHSAVHGEKDLPFLIDHRDRLLHFHIHDAKKNPASCHLALGSGDGSLDVRERLLLAGACHARCVLETKTGKALSQSISWLSRQGLGTFEKDLNRC